MKKLLLLGIAAVALTAAAPAMAGGLSIQGETGVARTPLAMALQPMQVAFAADYVASDDFSVPVRGELGLPYGIEVGGQYHYVDSDLDITIWSLNAKWVLPEFTKGLGLAVGGHYNAQEIEKFDNNGHDLYAVATYVAPMGEGMSIIPSFGVKWQSLTGDNEEDDFRFFGSLLFKMEKFAVGGEYISTSDKLDGDDADGSYWFGGRFFMNPNLLFQAGYLNNANFGGDVKDGVFHVGVQYAFSGN